MITLDCTDDSFRTHTWWRNILYHLDTQDEDYGDFTKEKELISEYNAKLIVVGKYTTRMAVVFENDADATAFLLKWS